MAALSTGAAEPGCHWRHGCSCGGYSACSGCAGCYGCGGYGYGAGCGLNACACYGASAYSCYGYCAGYCYGGYCMGGFTNYAPAYTVPPPVGDKKPEVVPNPKPKPKNPDETSLNDQARLILDVPADAKVYIDGKLMPVVAKRVYRTPKLDPRVTYYYDVTAEVVRDGKTVTSTKRVIVRANEQVRTAFADLPTTPAEATASAK
jgi:uncharacterized protein (TIGR03000 family)